MKTNQVLIRKMGEFEVLQRTSDGMFNSTLLLTQWNRSNKESKEISKFFENSNTKKFITALMLEENLHTQNSAYVKSRASKGSNAGTWMHPILFVKFAMWLNPRFEVKVIKFVYDELIKYRNDAGDAYREMSSSISRIVDKSFMPVAIQNIAKALNHIVFSSHESDIRNKQADESKMRELFELERKVSSLINEGFIISYEQLVKYLRKIWSQKHTPKALIV